MSSAPPPSSSPPLPIGRGERFLGLGVAGAAFARLLVLVVLCGIVFRDAVRAMAETALTSPEEAHILGAAVLAALVIFRRRALMDAAGRGSAWGLALVALALVAFVFASWPFNYAIPRRLAIVPALAGCALVAGGWRFLRLCAPLLVMVVLCVPLGTRFYTFLIIRPEELTIPAVGRALETLIPGVSVEQSGHDLLYERGGASGAIALGHSYRGASLLLAYALLVVFATSIRIRPWWQGLAMAVAAGPIVAASNFVRLFVWGAATIAAGASPLSLMPRTVATVTSLVFAWIASVACLWALDRAVPRTVGDARAAPAAGAVRRAHPLGAAFLVTAAPLGASAVALQPAIAGLIAATAKEPIGPRRSIRWFDAGALPSFTPAPEVEIAGASPGDDVGTDELIMTSVRQVRGAQAGRTYVVFVTYYTDPRATIPHTPEVCYRQAGASVRSDRTVTLPAPALRPEAGSIDARLLEVASGKRRQYVMYVLAAEGVVCAGREEARWRIGLPGAKRTYFSKVEVITGADGARPDEIIDGCGLLLEETLALLYAEYWPTPAQLAGE